MDLTQGLPVSIHLETYVTQDGETASHVFDEPGTAVQIGDTLYLRYKEINSAENTAYPVTMRLRPNGTVQLTRGSESDDTHLRLHFENERRVVTRYRTPYGVMPVETVTPRLDIDVEDDPFRGEVYIEYELFGAGNSLGNYRLRLQFSA